MENVVVDVLVILLLISDCPSTMMPAGLLRHIPVNGRTSIVSDTCRFTRCQCCLWTMSTTEFLPLMVTCKIKPRTYV